MNPDTKEISAIVPGEETEDREQLMKEIAAEAKGEEEIEEEDEIAPPRPAKKRFVLAFGGFVAGCVLMIAAVSWFFGIGFFSTQQAQPVNRTAKTDSQTGPVSEEDKLRMALSMVAEKPVAESSPAVVEGEQSAAPSVLDLPANNSPGSAVGVALPEAPSFSPTSEIPTSGTARKSEDRGNPAKPVTETTPTLQERIRNASPTELQVMGRSVFFGREKEAAPKIEAATKPKAPLPAPEPVKADPAIPFGTLLPIRLLGGVQTFGNRSGFVRMELTQPFAKSGLEYPAGTTIIGTLKNSESSRAFISVVGLIDPATGSLTKFGGDVLGPDGASGLQGRKRNVKNGWSRAMAGLRDVGTAALGAIGSWRSGGTVLITDASQKTSEILSAELSGKEKNSGEFVELTAGTAGYVLVTQLPKEAEAK